MTLRQWACEINKVSFNLLRDTLRLLSSLDLRSHRPCAISSSTFDFLGTIIVVLPVSLTPSRSAFCLSLGRESLRRSSLSLCTIRPRLTIAHLFSGCENLSRGDDCVPVRVSRMRYGLVPMTSFSSMIITTFVVILLLNVLPTAVAVALSESTTRVLPETVRNGEAHHDDDYTVSRSINIHESEQDDDTVVEEPSGNKNDAGSTNTNQNDDTIVFQHFVAHNDSMTCSSDEHARPFNNQIRGVNLGGWMVLEPWITPSLFYQFLGNDVNTTAFDMYTFCTVLGAQEANAQLRRHWETWVTEDIVQQLADSGAVNSVRLPVGDFQFVPYGPYEDCVDGGLEYVDRLLDWAYSRGISVLFDVHTARDSQNGFDNSGQAMGFEWTSALSSEFAGLTTFEHWPIRTANWIGTFDAKTATYTDINHDNIAHSLKVIRRIVHMYGGHPAVLGLEPLNEPWQYTPINELKRFYWQGYLIVKRRAPYWKYIMHDSFRLDTNVWGGFMDGCPERALDTHIYQAWRDPDSRVGFYTDACRQKSLIAAMENAFGPVIVGEWSLATDNCGTWQTISRGCALLGICVHLQMHRCYIFSPVCAVGFYGDCASRSHVAQWLQ
jgi:Cellulase (glycosyl hydrolase family 5)